MSEREGRKNPTASTLQARCFIHYSIPANTDHLYNIRTTRNVDPMVGWCWPTVFDAGQTLTQHWVNVSCLLGPASDIISSRWEYPIGFHPCRHKWRPLWESPPLHQPRYHDTPGCLCSPVRAADSARQNSWDFSGDNSTCFKVGPALEGFNPLFISFKM